MNVRTISPEALQEKRQTGSPVELIDVRTPAEYREMHVDFARNVPLETLDSDQIMAERNGSNGNVLHFICRTGSRGKKACEKFLAAGFTHVANVDGGTLAWEAAGLPVTRGKKAISLERQVRIAAGSLVLLGAILGWLVHPALLGPCAFVGAGLAFAGITDTCGMATVLAKMPWNQVKDTPKCCAD